MQTSERARGRGVVPTCMGTVLGPCFFLLGYWFFQGAYR